MNNDVKKKFVNSPELEVLRPALDGSQSLFGDTVVELLNKLATIRGFDKKKKQG